MATFTIELPDSFSDKIPATRHFIVVKLYEAGKIGLERAALIAEVTREEMLTLLEQYGKKE